MANNYCESSSMLILTPAQLELAKPIVARVTQGIEDDEESLGVQVTFEEGGIWFRHDESIDVAHLVLLVQTLLDELAIDEPFVASWSYTCSKPVLGEFGGGACALRRGETPYYVDALSEAEAHAARPLKARPAGLPQELYKCDNPECGQVADRRALNYAKDTDERIAPGEPYTDVECPTCGFLCHPVEKAEPVTFDGKEMTEIFEIARLALADAALFDHVAGAMDLSDDYMTALRDKVIAYTDADAPSVTRVWVVCELTCGSPSVNRILTSEEAALDWATDCAVENMTSEADWAAEDIAEERAALRELLKKQRCVAEHYYSVHILNSIPYLP